MHVENKEIVISGRFPRIVGLKAEYFEWVEDPISFRDNLKNGVRADLFTFMQEPANRNHRHKFHLELDSISVLSITTYENWWKKQITGKTRNMVRKAQKKGIEVRVVEFSDELVHGIKCIYDESPMRQGKPFKHYRKDFETLKRDHITYLERSKFIGAFFNSELVGFAKLVHGRGISSLMQIISKISFREKAPTNALIAKAVEICEKESVPLLHYGIWSRRGLGDFKKNNGFEKFDLQRYFIPLNFRGTVILALGLHRKISERLPEGWLNHMIGLRSKWYSIKFKSSVV